MKDISEILKKAAINYLCEISNGIVSAQYILNNAMCSCCETNHDQKRNSVQIMACIQPLILFIHL